MKIVHLMKNEKFTKGVVRFYNQFFNTGEHEILYYRKTEDSELIDSTCSIEQNEFLPEKHYNLVRYLKSLKCDYIVLHSLFLTAAEKVKLLLDRQLFSKIVWIEWGADLYSWKYPFGIKNIIKNQVNFLFRNKVNRIICIFPPDIDYFHKKFPRSKGSVFYAPYKSYPVDEEFQSYKEESKLDLAIKKGDTIYIQIGQNSLETLNHVEVLHDLERFRDENIRLFLPLNYGGTKEYADSIEQYANALFPGKVIVLRDFMPKEEYFKLTQKISIAIFDTERQCGLGNINRLNFRNVKVYLSEKGPMYKYFREKGVPVEKYENIKTMSFEDFIQPLQTTEKEKFNSYINELSSIDVAVNQWREIYESMRLSLNAK